MKHFIHLLANKYTDTGNWNSFAYRFFCFVSFIDFFRLVVGCWFFYSDRSYHFGRAKPLSIDASSVVNCSGARPDSVLNRFLHIDSVFLFRNFLRFVLSCIFIIQISCLNFFFMLLFVFFHVFLIKIDWTLDKVYI